MKLKSLEISGFKSFASKIKIIFHFPSKITAIVGPNGSGKSNVADAIKWVLGERDLKGLRISKNEDIIFGGTPSKTRMSLAQVSLILDNSKKELPVDFNEIVITRKLSRDGESEYLINNSNVRLKDIIELLAKAKIGYQGISIINQGSADNILKVSPKERRLMLEENFGLKEFQIKKEEAKRRLINTEDNLIKTKNLIDEISPHLRSLRRQVNRWEKKEEIENNLKKLEKVFFGFQFKKIFSDKENILKNKKEVEDESEKEKKILNELENKFKELDDKKPDFSNQFQQLQNSIGEIEDKKGKVLREIGNIEGQIESFKRITPKPTSHFHISIKELKDILNEIKDVLEKSLNSDNLEESRNIFTELLKKVKNVFEEENEEKENEMKDEEPDDKISEESKKLLIQKNQLTEKLEKLEKEIEKFNFELKELRIKDEQSGRESREILLGVEKKRREIDNLRQKINQFSLEEERIKIREDDLKDKLKEFEINSENFSEEEIKKIDLEEEMKNIGFENDFNGLESKIFRLRRDLNSIGEIDELIIKESKETEERHNFLTKELDDLLKAKEDLENMKNELGIRINEIFSSSLKEINKEFNQYFRIMFEGGSAKLSLIPLKKKNELNEDDDSEKEKEEDFGIEFNLELPKKKISGLESLSGGERTLVSISIMFAIVSAMNPPFVVLDEIDAALDESNSKRFSKILDELDDHTQFVIITHNRNTMESSQSLYGITMAEQGISKSVSLKLEEV
jgi:chromosome segregation protein